MSPIDDREHMRRCLVRQMIRWRVQRNSDALAQMRRSGDYETLRRAAEWQWSRGNRGEYGEWIE